MPPTLTVNGKSDGLPPVGRQSFRSKREQRERAVVAARREDVHARGDRGLHRARVGEAHGPGVLVREPHLVASAGAVRGDVGPAVADDRVHRVAERDERRTEVEDRGVRRDRLDGLDVHRPLGDAGWAAALLLAGTGTDRDPLDRGHARGSDGVGPLLQVAVAHLPVHDDGDVFAVALHPAIVERR